VLLELLPQEGLLLRIVRGAHQVETVVVLVGGKSRTAQGLAVIGVGKRRERDRPGNDTVSDPFRIALGQVIVHDLTDRRQDLAPLRIEAAEIAGHRRS
jgi:hypothetical protein